MSQGPADAMRSLLRSALTDARRRRDAPATSGLRAALAAIDNAEAIEPVELDLSTGGRIAGSAPDLAANEVQRRPLDEDQVAALLSGEIAERRATADDYDALGRPERAAALRTEADAIAAVTSGAGAGPAP